MFHQNLGLKGSNRPVSKVPQNKSDFIKFNVGLSYWVLLKLILWFWHCFLWMDGF